MLNVSNFPPVVVVASASMLQEVLTSDLSIVTEVKPVLVVTTERRKETCLHFTLDSYTN